MAGETISPNMSLPVPGVSVTTGPQWATDVNACLSQIDSHDHSSGKGVLITPSGINISSDLNFSSNNAFALRSTRYVPQGSPLALGTDIGCLYVSGLDLYYNDVNGNQVRITTSGSVNAGAGSITGLPSGTASVAFGSAKYTFQSAALTPATIDVGSVIIRNTTASANGVTLSPINALGSNYSLVLPVVPGATSFLQLDTSGNITSGPAISGGLTTSNLNAAAGILGPQLATNLSLRGTPSFGSFPMAYIQEAIVRNYKIIRGIVTSVGTIVEGSGFTVNRSATGTYDVTFTVPFSASSNPAVVVTTCGTLISFGTVNGFPTNTGAQVVIFTYVGAQADSNFSFEAVGIA